MKFLRSLKKILMKIFWEKIRKKISSKKTNRILERKRIS